MNQQLAAISEHVLIALIAAGGVVAGSIITIVGQLVKGWADERRARQRDDPRRALLRTMLNDPRWKWRNLDRLSHVIGADAETTKRLLLDVDARASEDGSNLWGLLSRNPLGSDDSQ